MSGLPESSGGPDHPKGRELMSPLTESIITDELMNAARRMLLDGRITTDRIAYYVGLPTELIEQLKEELKEST